MFRHLFLHRVNDQNWSNGITKDFIAQLIDILYGSLSLFIGGDVMDDFESAVVQHYQFLVKSALSFTREHSLSQDLVQDTVLSALAKRHLFVPGTNLKAWLYTILRNRFFTIKR